MATRAKSRCRFPGCSELLDVAGYCDKHKQQVGWNKKKTSSSARGYGSAWRRLREAVIQRDQGLCQECLRLGQLTAGRDVDHIVPKYLGGADDLRNLQTLCPECHKKKTQAESRQSRARAKIADK